MESTTPQRNTEEEVSVLSPRWLKFLELYQETSKAKESALAVGFSESYATVIASRMPAKVKKSLREALEAQGITPEYVGKKVKWLMSQKNYKAVDAGVRHAAKIGIGDGYAPEKSDVNTKNLNVNVDMQSNVDLEEIAKQVAKQLRIKKTQ